MQKQAPSLGRIATMAVFALSCFGLLLYLWSSFGGSVPLGARGYQFDVRFGEAIQLTENADVRIAGVNVGKVVRLEPDGDRTRATVEVDARYAPIPRDTRAVLRVKTLLGETYVELSHGSERAGDLPDGGALADGQVAETVELDEVLRTFDPRTRTALRHVVRGLARSLEGRAGSVNASLGSLAPLTADAASLTATLDRQRAALGRVTRDTGAIFESLGRREGELAALTGSLASLLDATADRDQELTASVRALPATLRELRATLVELRSLATEAGPVVTALRPSGRALEPAVGELSRLAPELVPLFGDLRRLATAARTGLPAGTNVVERLLPVVRVADPILAEALPAVQYLSLYEADIAATFAGGAAATDARAPLTAGGPPLRYLRALVPVTAEALLHHDRRLGSNRSNAYRRPRALDSMARPEGVPSFDCRHASNPVAPHEALPCYEQEPLEFQGRRLRYPHVERDPDR